MSRPFNVHESVIASKTGIPSDCEDVVADGPAFVVVCDGATDKTGLRFDGITGGRLVAEIVCEVVASALTGTPGSKLVELINQRITERFGEWLKGRDPSDIPAASFCAVDKVGRRVIRVGDTSWRSVGRIVSGGKEIDVIAANARAALLASLLTSANHHDVLRDGDPGREMILPLFRAQASLRNNPLAGSLGYGAIDGRPVPQEFIEEWQVADDEHDLVVTTDGYPEVFMSLKECETYLQHSLQTDPLRIGMHRTTKGLVPGQVSFGDRAFVRLSDRE